MPNVPGKSDWRTNRLRLSDFTPNDLRDLGCDKLWANVALGVANSETLYTSLFVAPRLKPLSCQRPVAPRVHTCFAHSKASNVSLPMRCVWCLLHRMFPWCFSELHPYSCSSEFCHCCGNLISSSKVGFRAQGGTRRSGNMFEWNSAESEPDFAETTA